MKMEERTEGDERHGGSQIGGRLAARICIYSKTVICHGQRHMEIFRDRKKGVNHGTSQRRRITTTGSYVNEILGGIGL